MIQQATTNRLPESVFDLERLPLDFSKAKYECRYWDASGEVGDYSPWRPCVILDRNGSVIVVAYERGDGGIATHRFDSRGNEWRTLIRPRVEKRKRWFLIDHNDTVMSNTKDENIAREWMNTHIAWSVVEVEYTPGERPKVDEKDKELKPGMRVMWDTWRGTVVSSPDKNGMVRAEFDNGFQTSLSTVMLTPIEDSQ